VRTIWVTGVSGAGKSAFSRRLAAFGYEAASTDSAPGLCRWVDDAGRPAERPGDPDLAWLATHHWMWDPARLDQLLAFARERGVETQFLCGHAANALDLAARFDLTVLLRIDLATMLARLDDPARGNDFGRVGHSRQHLIDAFQQWQAHLQRHADVVIDATADLDTVTRKVAYAAGPRLPVRGALAPYDGLWAFDGTASICRGPVQGWRPSTGRRVVLLD
jgi:hypothetical protein